MGGGVYEKYFFLIIDGLNEEWIFMWSSSLWYKVLDNHIPVHAIWLWIES